MFLFKLWIKSLIFYSILSRDKVKLGIVKGIIDITASLSMHCIVKGVEKITQKESLEKFEGRRFQGYYFSYSLVVDELTAFSYSKYEENFIK